ncbi:glycosyltransferase [Carboxylicivirga sp. N1Y90]|uniref:glycosyltransferase n=1 Tax=Carboxylicivirga fragile TaxID=3417571 RepID=UPI003D32D3C4|nr:glycosyltransferase [Marinilabiliaceae bacterium N1Y90]
MTVSFFIPEFEVGGIQRVFINLSRMLVKRGYDVNFIVCRKKGALLNELERNINVYSLGKNKRLRNSFMPLMKVLKAQRPDYVITGSDVHNKFVILANLLAGKPTRVIATHHNYFDEDIKGKTFYPFVYFNLMRILYPLAHKVVVVSDGLKKYLNERCRLNNLVRIYNPFDVDEISEKSQVSNIKLKVLPDKYFLFAGRLSSVKNVSLLIRAFDAFCKKNENYKLVIAGSGGERDMLEQYGKINNIADSLIFLGDVSHCYYLIKHAKLVLSTSFSEALPSIVIESLMLGKTVVSTPNNGAKEVLKNGDLGYLSESFVDSDSFAQLIELAIKKPIDSAKLQERANEFNFEKIAGEYIRVLN